ncbi:MAG: type II and III secretion system protein family protein [Mariniblastus sp.]
MNMRKTLLLCCCFAVATATSFSPTLAVQGPLGPRFEVNNSVESLNLIAGSSQRLKFPYNVPELMVENPEIVTATPVAQNEILITAVKPGISTITISDPQKNLQTITIEVTIDVRKLERAFATHFPDSQIEVDALKTAVILKGYVARADQVQNILAVAQDYFPTNVINELQVSGSQNIAIEVKVYEVSRTKLRQLGVDWSFLGADVTLVSSVADLIQNVSTGTGAVGQNISFGVLNDSNQFNAFIQALEQNSLAKLLDQPTLVAQNGRPAEFLSGGEVPIQVAAGLGANAVEFRPFGTKLDLVPIVHGAGELTLEVRAEVSEIAADLAGESGVPGFRVRRVNTGVKMKAGHTLALAGDYREDVSTTTRGIPMLMHSPVIGPIFRRIEEEKNETELVFLLTPRFVSEVDASMAPRLGPGQLTGSPSDRELYINGHIEVPRCNEDCPVDNAFSGVSTPSQFQPGTIGQTQPVQSQGYQNSYYQQPNQVTPQFESSYRFPQNGSPQPAAKPVAKQANGGFLWPTNNTKRR